VTFQELTQPEKQEHGRSLLAMDRAEKMTASAVPLMTPAQPILSAYLQSIMMKRAYLQGPALRGTDQDGPRQHIEAVPHGARMP
jgi:hypothetical protein